jgi:ABC-type antimicrobial peptide transport system permease subunit
MGSGAGQVFGLVVGQGMRVVALGLILGGVGSLALVRLIRSLLYGVEPADPAVIVSVGLLLAATGLAACILPARRATRIDPVEALAD